MKRIYAFIIITCIANNYLFAQQTAGNAQVAPASKYLKPFKFHVTKPLRDFPEAKPMTKTEKQEAIERMQEEYYKNRPKPKARHDREEIDPVRQSVMGNVIPDTPLVNFQTSPLQAGFCPPDPDGAVGMNRYVEVDNCDMAVYDKSGHVIMAPRQIGWIWDSNNLGDPVVLYDKFADRWFVSQLEFNWTTLDVAVSVTNDPTGAYYVWYYNMGYLPDYPKYSIWPDGYYCTYQNFTTAESVLVLERNRMLQGDANAGLIMDSIPGFNRYKGNNIIALSPKALDCDGVMPPYGTPNFLFYYDNINSGGPADQIIIWKMATDTTNKTLVITKYDSLTPATFDADFSTCGGFRANIPQPGLGKSLDALDGPFNFRVPYMRFTGYGSIVLSNTVNLGNCISGIRWYELHLNDTTLKWSIYQQGTYAPNDGICRWNASICMNDNGNIALAYSVSDSISVYPGLRYTGRLSGDPLGQMTFAEETAIAGRSAQTNSGRWGDYSCTNVDPADGTTFWHTNEYMGDSGIQKTRVFAFQLKEQNSGVNAISQNPYTSINAYQSGNMLNVKATNILNNERVDIGLFDMNGKQLSSVWLSPAMGMVQTKIDVGNLAAATYILRVGNVNFQTVKKIVLNVGK